MYWLCGTRETKTLQGATTAYHVLVSNHSILCFTSFPSQIASLLLLASCNSLTSGLSFTYDFCAMLTSHSDSTFKRRHTHEPVDGLKYEFLARMMRHCKICFNNISNSCREVPIDNNRRPHASHLRDQSVQAYCGEHDAEIFWGIDNRKNRCETMLLSALCHNNGPACGMSS